MIVVIQGYFTPVWFLPLPSVCLLFINMCKCRPSYKFSSFLHINYVPSQCLASWVKICSSKLIKCLLPFVMSVSLLQQAQQTCPVPFNPDWLLQDILFVQNKSGQISKALSFLQSLFQEQFVRVGVFEKTFINFLSPWLLLPTLMSFKLFWTLVPRPQNGNF